MSSDPEYYPGRQCSNASRRSKRITRSDAKNLKIKTVKKNNDKIEKKSATKIKQTSRKKSAQDETLKNKESEDTFSSEYLKPEEIQQLFLKFQRDGHFRLNNRHVSSPPIVISRTTNGNTLTTRIERCKTNHQLVRDITTTFGGSTPGINGSGQTNDSTSVTFSTPLSENLSATSLPSTITPDMFVSAFDEYSRFCAMKNCNKKNSYPWLDRPKNVATNGYCENFNGSNIHSKPISALGNGFFFQPNNAFHNNNNLKDRDNFFNCNNPNEIAHGNIDFENRYENYSNVVGIEAQDTFNQPRKGYPADSNFSMHDAFDTFDKWNATMQMSSNTIGNNSSTTSTTSIAAMSANSMNFHPPGNITYNSETASVNDCSYNVQPNRYSLTNDVNGYRWPFGNYNDVQSFNNSLYCNVYQTSEKCETSTRPITGDPINCWPLENGTDKELFDVNGLGTGDSTPMTLNNFHGIATTIDDNGPGNITDISRSINEQIEQNNFNLEQLPDYQNSALSTTSLSSCSFDDDIAYDNYTDDNVSGNNENTKSTTEQNVFTARLPSVMSIKTELRPWYHRNNYGYANNDESIGTTKYSLNNFDAKNEFVNLTDSFVNDNISRS